MQVNHEFVVVDARTFLTSEQQSLQACCPGHSFSPYACVFMSLCTYIHVKK